jgi:hypothetical protein
MFPMQMQAGFRRNKAHFLIFLLVMITPACSLAIETASAPPFTSVIASSALERQDTVILTANQRISRKKRLTAVARGAGVAGGSLMGVAALVWNATGVDGAEGSFGEQLLGSVPSIALGSYVGLKMSDWMVHRIMRGEPGPLRAGLRGALYGFAAGSVTLTASLAPLFVIGRAAGTIDFNNDPNYLQILGSSALGGIAFGGPDGLLFGCMFGPSVSLSLRF